MTVGVVLLTLNAEADLPRSLPPLLADPIVTRCLVVDSSSKDSSVELARRLGAEVRVIDRADFNHGATREMARKALGTDIVVMVTQDAYAVDDRCVTRLVAPIIAGQADVAYGRQLTKDPHNIFESYPREFNYPAQSHSRRIADVKRYGVFTFFCSDSFAAYRQSSLDAIGGLPTVLTNEDYFAVARLLERGGTIAYVAETAVLHSHKYTLKEEFQRYFDTGYVRGERQWVQKLVGDAEGHGASMVKALLKKILRESPGLLPYAIIQCGVKWLGYRVGYYSVKAPRWWKIAASGQKYFWTSRFASLPVS